MASQSLRRETEKPLKEILIITNLPIVITHEQKFIAKFSSIFFNCRLLIHFYFIFIKFYPIIASILK
jgi:hypothetical protein